MKEEWENVGERLYMPGIDHGLLYIRPEIIGPNDSVVYDGDEPIVLKPGKFTYDRNAVVWLQETESLLTTICGIEGCYGQHPECGFRKDEQQVWSWGDDITEDHIIRGTE